MDAMPVLGAITLASEPWSVSAARRYVRGLLDEEGIDADDVEQVLCELVANAVAHGGSGRVALVVGIDATATRVEVTDGGDPEGRPWRQAGDPLSEGGRGLVLVEALAERWGVESRPDRTRVWAEIARK